MRCRGCLNECSSGSTDIVIHEPCSDAAGFRTEEIATSDLELQERIVRHCSPTLAGLKCGSMFKIASASHGLTHSLRRIQSAVKSKGVRMMFLSTDDSGCLVYVYRQDLLAKRLADHQVQSFLREYGYSSSGVNKALAELRRRFALCPMPPEVGVFLDYPMEDIIGYIENSGRCSRCIGCWKVYGDAEAAERKFNMFRKCRDVYCRRLSEGYPISVLAVNTRIKSEPAVQ